MYSVMNRSYKQLTSKALNLGLSMRSLHTTFTRNAVEDKSSLLVVNESNGVREVLLNNPKKRNVLSLSMIESLRKVMVNNSSLRCVVISSNGPVFSSGHDLKELSSSKGSESHQELFESCSQLMLSIQKLEVPVICEVNGLAAAAGCQLVASCDIAVASDCSSFSTPGANVGLFCSTPSIPLSRCVHQKTAAFMLMTGNHITANEALRSGLVSRVVSEQELKTETENVVNAILSKSKAVIALGKQFFYSQINQNLETAYNNGSRVMVENLCLTDGQEGINAFIAKRVPHWTHSTDRIE